MTHPANPDEDALLLARYRQAVADMLEADMEARLTTSHLARIGCRDAPLVQGSQERHWIMKKFRAYFGAIEPERMRAIEEALEAQYEERNARNQNEEERQRPPKKPLAQLLEEALAGFDEDTKNLFGGMVPLIAQNLHAQLDDLHTAAEFRHAADDAFAQWQRSLPYEPSEAMMKILRDIARDALENAFSAWLEEHPSQC